MVQNQNKKGWDNFIKLVNLGRFSEITKYYLLPNLIHPNHLNNYALTSTIIDMSEDIGPDAYLLQLNAVATQGDLRPILKNISCPTLLLAGREDNVCPIALHKEMNEIISTSKLIIVKECGHLSSMDQPDVVTEALSNWLISF